MGASSTSAGVSSVAPIGNVRIFIYVVDLYQCMITHYEPDLLPLKVSHVGAHTEIPLASIMQARSTNIVSLVQSVLLVIYLGKNLLQDTLTFVKLAAGH